MQTTNRETKSPNKSVRVISGSLTPKAVGAAFAQREGNSLLDTLLATTILQKLS